MCTWAQNIHYSFVKSNAYPGRVLPYLGMVRRFCRDDPVLGLFNPNYTWTRPISSLAEDWVPILYLITIRLTPSFCKRINSSLSHLVPETLQHKVSLIFHQMYYLTDFKHFV